MLKHKRVFARQCDWCKKEIILNGPDKDPFVITADWKYFCIIQTPGQPAERDCMADYLTNINEKINKTKKELEIKKRQKEEQEKLEKEEKQLAKPRVLAKLNAIQKELKDREFQRRLQKHPS